MQRVVQLFIVAILAAPAALGADRVFNSAGLGPGAVVRVVARKPVINLARAEVTHCTSNVLTLRHREGLFEVHAADIFELTLLEAAPAAEAVRTPAAPGAVRAPDAAPQGSEARPSAESGQPGKSLWDRIKGLWAKVSPWAKAEVAPVGRPAGGK